jgi:hypothetical protein
VTPTTDTPPQAEHTFFTADAYDISPQITGGGTAVSATNYVPRYSLHWTSVSPAIAASNPNYLRQVGVPNSSGDSYVTCSTYHVAHWGKVIVLWESGSVETMDVSKFLAAQGAGGDPAALTASAGVGNANFWTVRP